MIDEGPWDRLQQLMTERDVNGLTMALDDLDDDQRPAVATSLRRFFRQYDEFATARVSGATLMGLVGAAVMPDARSTAVWITRHGLTCFAEGAEPWDTSRNTSLHPHALFVLTRRHVAWLPDLAVELTGRLSAEYADAATYDLITGLLAETGQEPPTDEGFVAEWARRITGPQQLLESLADDRRRAALVLRMFEFDRCGRTMDNAGHWPDSIAAATRSGLLERREVLDACLARLARAGKPGAARGYFKVLEWLSPTREELAARASDCVGTLRAAPSPIAAWAQRRVSELYEEGLISERDALDGLTAALDRPEKKIVRAALSRLPDNPGARLAVSTKLAELPSELAREAVAAVGKLADRLPLDERRHLYQAAGTLPRDLASDWIKALDLDPVRQPVPPRPTPSPPEWQPAALHPIEDVDELVHELTALFDWSERTKPDRLERVLAALGELREDDRHAVARALHPVTAEPSFMYNAQDPDVDEWDFESADMLHRGLVAVVSAALGLRAVVPRRPPDPPDIFDIAVARLFAVAGALRDNSGVPALALPSWNNGTIDAEDFVARAQRAARDGRRPIAIDVEQGLLRVSIPQDDATRRRLNAAVDSLSTFPPSSAAGWPYPGELRPPTLRPAVLRRSDTDWSGAVTKTWEDPAFELRAGPDNGRGLALWPRLTTFAPDRARYYDNTAGGRWCAAWLAPQHREIVAAHLIPYIAQQRNGANEFADVLPLLAATNGQFGPATALALGYGFGCARSEAQSAAVEAARILSSRKLLDGDTLGRTTGRLCADGTVVTGRVMTALRALAGAGAAHDVWLTLRAVLETMLESEPRTGMADVLGLAGDVAEITDARATVAGLAEFAGRSGRSRQLVEARRLIGLLAD